jgi:hypothetical protein
MLGQGHNIQRSRSWNDFVQLKVQVDRSERQMGHTNHAWQLTERAHLTFNPVQTIIDICISQTMT